MAKRENDHILKEVMEDLFRAYGWTDKMDGVKVINSWEKVAGKIVANHTSDLYVKNNKLYVKLDSSVLRNELFMDRSLITKKINKELGKKIINEIILI